jgi:hypothetical protein
VVSYRYADADVARKQRHLPTWAHIGRHWLGIGAEAGDFGGTRFLSGGNFENRGRGDDIWDWLPWLRPRWPQ